jgi:Flp pilus assembly protein TadD
MFWPVDLCVYYPLGDISATQDICSALILAGMSAWALGAGRRHPYLLVGWLWYLITLVPVIGLVQVSGQAMADRYTYVPLLGVFILIVWGAARWFRVRGVRRSVQLAVPGVLGLACLFATSLQLRHWRNGVWLFAHCVEVTQNNFLAHHNLAVALSARGLKEEAVAQFNESLRLNPNNAKGHYSVALDLAELGRPAEAMAHYNEATRLRPRDVPTRLNLGILLAEQGHVADATDQFLAAVHSEPGNAQAHLNLANALNQQGKTPEALPHYRAALDLAPSWPEALNRLACLLATHREARFRDGLTAVRLAEAANQSTSYSQPVLLNTLGAAYAEAGRFREAVVTEQRALRLVLESGPKGLSPQIQRCLELYQAGRSYRDGP